MAVGRGRIYQKLYGASVALHCCFFLMISSFLLLHVSCSSNEPYSFSLNPEANNDFDWQNLNNASKYPFPSPNGEIFLTNDPTDGASPSLSRYNVGRIIYKKPIPLDQYHDCFFSFNTSFKFNITTATKYNQSGDGIAFVMTTDAEIPQNSTGRFFGLMPESRHDRNQSFLAVEFDTFQNLQAEIDDPSASHIGIDISNLSSVAYLDTSNESHPLYLYHNYTITAWVSYNAFTQFIHVWASNTSDAVDRLFVAKFQCNLAQVFKNHTDLYVGIIAASGNNSQASILYTWSFMMVQQGHGPVWNEWPWYFKLLTTLGGLVALVIIAISLGLSTVVYRQRCRSAGMDDKIRIEDASSSGIRPYKYTELEKATNRFSDEHKVGGGGFSTVYKGILADGTEVAVKKMTVNGQERMAEAGSMAREVQIISRIRHRLLMPLRGWCYERKEALLVYDYMPNGSLDSYLHGAKRSKWGQVIDGEKRLNIIVGVAAALEYLHDGLPGQERVLHRDVKSANVLLTDSLEPMLADFGLSRLVASDNAEGLETIVIGTPGYLAPEVVQTGRVDDKADVYSFGVLTLEVACGRKALSPTADSQHSRLVDWVVLHHQRNCILKALDPLFAHPVSDFMNSSRSTNGQQPGVPETEEMIRWWGVLHLGLLCCQTDPDARPRMREVHQALKEGKVLPIPTHSLAWHLYPAAAASEQELDAASPLQSQSQTLYITC